MRARYTKELQDERCTAYFFERIRQRREKNIVAGVKNNKGEIETKDAKILEFIGNSIRSCILGTMKALMGYNG